MIDMGERWAMWSVVVRCDLWGVIIWVCIRLCWWQLMIVRLWGSGCVDLFGLCVGPTHIIWGSVLGIFVLYQSGKWSYGLVSFLQLSVMKKLTCVRRGHVGVCTRVEEAIGCLWECLIWAIILWLLPSKLGHWLHWMVVGSGEFLDCVMSTIELLWLCVGLIFCFSYLIWGQRRLLIKWFCICGWSTDLLLCGWLIVLFCILAVQMMSGEPDWFVYTSYCSK